MRTQIFAGLLLGIAVTVVVAFCIFEAGSASKKLPQKPPAEFKMPQR